MLLGIVIGLLVGAGIMHLINKKKVDGLTISLSEIQSKLKSTRNQLYRKRATYNKKRNAGSNGKKTKKKAIKKPVVKKSNKSKVI